MSIPAYRVITLAIQVSEDDPSLTGEEALNEARFMVANDIPFIPVEFGVTTPPDNRIST